MRTWKFVVSGLLGLVFIPRLATAGGKTADFVYIKFTVFLTVAITIYNECSPVASMLLAKTLQVDLGRCKLLSDEPL